MSNEIKFVVDKVCFHGEDVWFIEINFGLLCRLDIRTGEIKFAEKIPLASNVTMQYRRMVSYKDSLVLIPYNSLYVLIYNIIEGTFENVKIVDDSKRTYRMMFADAYIYKDEVLFIPARYSAFVKMNMNTKELRYFKDWDKEYSYNRNLNVFSGNVLAMGNELFVPYWQSYKLLKINMDDMTFETIDSGLKGNGICAICGENNSIMLAAKDRLQIISMDLRYSRDNQLKDIITSGINATGVSYISKCGAEYLLYPSVGNQIVKINEDGDVVSVVHQWEYKIADDYKKYACGDLVFLGVTEHRNILFSYSQCETKLLAIDKESGAVDGIELKVPDNEKIKNLVKSQKNFMLAHNIIDKENELIGLADFINYICNI